METTLSKNGRTSRIDPNLVSDEPGDAPRQWRSATGQEISDLMADVQDLLGRVAHVADPEVIRLRAKVADALSTAKASIAQGSDSVRRHARDAAGHWRRSGCRTCGWLSRRQALKRSRGMFEQIARAAPLLARHASAYGDLIANDGLSAWQAFARRLWVGVALAMAVLLAILLSCAWLSGPL